MPLIWNEKKLVREREGEREGLLSRNWRERKREREREVS